MIYAHKTDLMRETIRLVSHGYHKFIQGEVPFNKTEALFLKFSDRYQINLTTQQRYRRKSRGEANSILLMCPDHDRPVLHWVLLVTEGEGLVHQMETLGDVRSKNHTSKKQRLFVQNKLTLTGYELVKTPRKGEGAKPQWTWRMTTANYEAWQERLRAAVRLRGDDALRQAWFSLRRVPGFSESRKQAYTLAAYGKAEWKRHRRGEFPLPDIALGWLGRFHKPTKIGFSALKI